MAVGMSTLVACFWAFWGTIENFHEGWHHPTLWGRLAWTGAYLGPMLISMALTLVSLRWPRLGGSIFVLVGLAFGSWWLRTHTFPNLGAVLLLVPLTGSCGLVGMFYWFGSPEPLRWATRVAVGLPLLVVVVCAVEPIWRIAGRVDDGSRDARLVEGNGVRLIWAPAGPGWERASASPTWEEAGRRCQFLAEDGKSLADTPQGLWRLPTVDEAVRSMARHGRNCGGTWHPNTRRATYEVRPDKESPLWDCTSPVIYWWTATEKNDKIAYMIVYHGGVFPKSKTLRMGSLGFRAVRPAPSVRE
jgi:hypothetical protein